MTEENLYTILGVDEKSSQDDIKKAYREKSKKLHPDMGGSEEDFKKINEAYSTLSDPQKRSQYDNRKNNPFGNFGGHGGFGDIFEQMFNFGGNPFAKKQKNNFTDKIIELNITPLESYLGVDKEVRFFRNGSCDYCSGKGGERHNCNACGGQGFFARTVSNGMFNQVFRNVCNQCQGNGYLLKNRCGVCSGNGTKVMEEKINIKLPHGIDDGQFLKVIGKGDFNGIGFGNLLLKIKMNSADNFEKVNNDLVYNMNFDLEDLKKDGFDIPHPGGKMNVKFPKEFDTSKPLRIKSKGYQGTTTGDLYVRMNVKYIRE